MTYGGLTWEWSQTKWIASYADLKVTLVRTDWLQKIAILVYREGVPIARISVDQ